MASNVDQQLQTMINNMPEKTGKSLEEWFSVLAASDLEKHGELMKVLKGEHGVTHGFANTIVSLFRDKQDGGPAPEADLVTVQYDGAKANLRPVYDHILAVVGKFGTDVEIAPKKSYVSLRRKKQFAIVKASTRTRVDLGLNLKGIEPTDRLEGGNVFSGMCSHLVKLSSSDDVDGEVVSWLQQAYDQA
jgi:hypothetical protein